MKNYFRKKAVTKKLAVAEKIYQQQLFMYRNKTHRVANRIVSFHREYVRPIKKAASAGQFAGARARLDR